MSSYAPAYVKTNQARFPRTEATRGQGQEILSPFVAANADVDARAFAALMRHLREVDGARHTVIMVQVENEPGTYGSVRDYSPAAEALFSAAVPGSLVQALDRQPGTWRAVFGEDADEFFHAWHIASYIEHVA